MPEIENSPEIAEPATEEKSEQTFIRPDGTVITRKEMEEEKERRESDPNWWREQK